MHVRQGSKSDGPVRVACVSSWGDPELELKQEKFHVMDRVLYAYLLKHPDLDTRWLFEP